MKTRRCALASGSFWPREGGAERQLADVLRRLDSAGIGTVVVTQVLPASPRHDTLPDGSVRIFRVGSLSAFKSAPRIGQLVFFVSCFVRLLATRPTVIVSLQFGAASAAASLVSRLARVPHLIRLTGGGTERYRSEPMGRASSWAGRAIVWVCSANPRALVVAPARHLLADFREAFPGIDVPLKFIPNGVTPPSSPLPGIGARQGVVWYARSGAQNTAGLFREIAERCPNIPFTIVGREQVSGDLPNVNAVGWTEDIYSVLGAARILLNTSKTEGSPNLALQAVAAGCHVLGAMNAGIVELRTDHPDHVQLFPYGDAADAATKLRELYAKEVPLPAVVPTADSVAGIWTQALIGAGS